MQLALSGAGVRFHRVRVLGAFADPGAIASQPGSLALVRLASENVMLAWTAEQQGRHVVLLAPAVFAGARPPTVLAPASGDAVLAALAPDVGDGAVALWRAAPVSSSQAGPWQLWAGRAVLEPHARVGLSSAAMIAQGISAPALAVDPGNGRPVAAWLAPGGSTVAYSDGPAPQEVSAPLAPPAAPAAGGGAGWPAIAVPAALALVAVLAAVALRARAHGHAPGGPR